MQILITGHSTVFQKPFLYLILITGHSTVFQKPFLYLHPTSS